MSRNQKVTLFTALAIIGGAGIGLSMIPAVGPLHNTAPGAARIVAGTLIVAAAMVWACYFAVRAHFAQDEFKRQREVQASYWGCWLGIAASAPVFVFISIGGLGRLAAMHAPPLYVFMTGYLLPTICAAIGTISARFWLRYRDS